jgi:hypothetical protein
MCIASLLVLVLLENVVLWRFKIIYLIFYILAQQDAFPEDNRTWLNYASTRNGAIGHDIALGALASYLHNLPP